MADRRRVLAALGIASALAPLNSTMLSVALPDIGRALGRDAPTLTGALVNSYLVASIVTQSPGGRVGDLLGHRRALALGQCLFAAGAVLAAALPTLATLAAARVLMAVGGGVIVPSATALLRDEVPPASRGRAFGAFGALMGVAAMLGPLAGGALTARFGYRAVFAVNLPLLALSAVLAMGGSPSRASGSLRSSFDASGTALLALSLGSLVVGARAHGGAQAALLALGLVTGALFAAHERRVPSPVIDLSLLRRPALAAGAAVIALQNLAIYALIFALPGFLGRRFGMGAAATGRTVLAMMGAMVLTAPLAGRLVDRFGPRRLATSGCALTAAACVALARMNIESPAAVLPALVAMGVGIGLSGSPAQAAAMTAAPKERGGTAAGLVSTLRYLGGVAGIVLLGALGGGETADSFQRAATAFAAALALALAASLALPDARLGETARG